MPSTEYQAMGRCRTLFICEGPDNAGKTTLAKLLAKRFNAHYVHGGPFPAIHGFGLARMYAEMMIPALLGHKDVVMDRCWMSEYIYGTVFRDGEDRLGPDACRMLERYAMRCDVRVALCLPAPGTARQALGRRGEYLTTQQQLDDVEMIYHEQHQDGKLTALPGIVHDRTRDRSLEDVVDELINGDSVLPHWVQTPSGGNLEAPYVIIGEAFANHQEHDPYLQIPFASFSRSGCSMWLTEQLRSSNLDERDLLWLNADFGKEAIERLISYRPRQQVFALGKKAHQAIQECKIASSTVVTTVPHPQHEKRFNYHSPYMAFRSRRWS